MPLTVFADPTGKLKPDIDYVVKLLSASFGLSGLFLHFVIKKFENAIEQFMDGISDKRECAKQFAKSLDFRDIEFITAHQVVSPQISIFPPVAPFLSRIDLTEPLIAKTVSHGLVQAEKTEEITPQFVQRYKVLFKPSLFKIDYEPEQMPEPKPMTKSDSLSMAVTGFVLSSIAAVGTLYLWRVKGSYWAFLSGFFSLGFLGTFSMAIMEFYNLKKKELVEEPKESEVEPNSDI